jgi:hypothetical protein
MKKMVLALMLAGASVAPAGAVVVNFDDLSGAAVLTGSYGGINWGGNWRHYDTVQAPYTPASGTQRIFRNYSIWGVGVADIPFTFNTDVVFEGAAISGYAISPVVFMLFNDGSLVHTTAAFTPSSIPTFAATGYTGLVDEVRVSGRQILTLDNVTYSPFRATPPEGPIDRDGPAGIPEPGSWAMLITGFGLVGALLRRRRAAIA